MESVKLVQVLSDEELEELAKQLYKYAETHYNAGGWDVIVECMEISEIFEDLKEGYPEIDTRLSQPVKDFEDALKVFESRIDIWSDRQAEAKFYEDNV